VHIENICRALPPAGFIAMGWTCSSNDGILNWDFEKRVVSMSKATLGGGVFY